MEIPARKLPLAANLKNRRQALNLSLETLSHRSGVSRAMISDIERELKNPSIAIVSQLAEGLGCSISELLGEADTLRQRVLQVLKRDEQQLMVDPHSGLERRLLSGVLLGRGIEVVEYIIPAGQTTGQFPAHQRGTVEHITVVEGKLACYLGEDTEAVELDTGDTIYFPADMGHRFQNPGQIPCRYILIIDTTQVQTAR